MIKLVIFDGDGTLVDTVDMQAEAWPRALKEFGKEVDFSTVRSQIGKGGDQLMPVFLSREELDQFGEQLEKRRREMFKQEYLQKTKAFPTLKAKWVNRHQFLCASVSLWLVFARKLLTTETQRHREECVR
ncbi:MAG TPA: HAD hydrolase-like protein [Pyrinomonadaceae bacterium]